MEPEDYTRPTAFGPRPDLVKLDRTLRQQRLAAVIATYCTPLLKYDGISAWEVAGKLIDVLDLEASQ